ncbi:MAG: undecaprenyl-phosphate galactose phosphotransferase WbaP [Planctomycetaceae bacterium]|nr:undecaprenyl-phosphate galactose phosphotransferase WbaP [Planctomycetaceae bacterium]
MASPSRLIQPLISTDAVSTLAHVVPGRPVLEGFESTDRLTTRADSVSRYRQAVLTSMPLIAADLLAISVSYLSATVCTHVFIGIRHYSGLWNNLFAIGVCYLMVGFFLGLFPASGMNPVRELRSQISAVSISFVLLIALNGLLGEVTINEILTIAIAFPMTFALAPPSRFCTRRIVSRYRWWGEKVIIVGSNPQGLSVYQFLRSHPQRGLKPLGIVDDSPSNYWRLGEECSFDFLGTIDELVSICRKEQCHWVIAAVAEMDTPERQQILSRGSLIPNLVVIHSLLSMPTIWPDSFDAAGLAGVHIRDRMLFPFQRHSKRLMDIVLSSLLLILCLPVYLGIYVWVRMKSNGDVLFQHRRIGRSGKPFGAWKFRTMVPDASKVLTEYLSANPAASAEWDEFHKLRNDPRVIPGVGAFLRRTSLDELPQLWNVLIGEMSLVGPRPVYTMDEIRMYGELYPLYLRLRPGLTGLWQVSGRNNTTFADKVRLDTYYSMNWSLWLDYFILLRTVRTVLTREGSC